MISRHRNFHATLPPRRRLPRAAIFVVVFSVCGVAMAALSPSDPPPPPVSPEVVAADEATQVLVDERLHLHLKRALAVAGR